jgi:NADH-quinone oxidoreductase subunit J
VEFVFYSSAAVAVLATFRVISNSNPVHALLNLVVSLLAIAMIFFTLGAPFAAALEMIVYAGAIMVLFVFVVMMLNLGDSVVHQEKKWLQPGVWLVPVLLTTGLLLLLIYALNQQADAVMGVMPVDAKQVGIALFGPYILVVELASLLLLAALVSAFHIGRHDENE